MNFAESRGLTSAGPGSAWDQAYVHRYSQQEHNLFRIGAPVDGRDLYKQCCLHIRRLQSNVTAPVTAGLARCKPHKAKRLKAQCKPVKLRMRK